jgi:hypothetical protein
MKCLTLFSLLCLYTFAALGQKLPDYGLNKVRITDTSRTILAVIAPVSSPPTANTKVSYYWYSADAIHATQGGYSGKLLNGPYIEYYPDKNLKQQGTFKKGLKEGIWKTWNTDGTLHSITKWKHGVEKSDKRVPLLKGLFTRKQKKTDTVATGKK